MTKPVSKQRRKILSEEEYTLTLTSIVQRDFFPELPELERQAAVLERRAQGDVAGAVAVRRATRRLQQHEEAMSAMEEEEEYDLDDNDAGPVRRRARPLHQESISGFHARATNEDDEEFDLNQKEEIRENRERLEQLFRAPNASVPLLTNMASDEFQTDPNRIESTEWNRPSVRNGFFFSPTPIRQPDAHSSEDMKGITNGPAMASSGSEYNVSLMPPPARPADKKAMALPKHQLVEYVPKHILEKRIDPSQTRFSSKIIPYSDNVGRGLIATSDLESETDGSVTDASTDLDAPSRPLDRERRNDQRRKEKAQLSYVAMTPLIVPGTAGNESPIMTWGKVDSTPLVISGQEGMDDEKQREVSYSVAGESGRERAAKKAEQELARRTKRAKTAMSSVSSRRNLSSVRQRTGSLTPAAVSLWQKTRQQTPSRSSDAFASSLRSSYTPIVRSKSSSSVASSKQRRVDNAFNATPLASRGQQS